MNGIINKSLIALFVMGGSAVANGGGLEFGWTQLPDGRVEYIIQLDDKAIEALKNGQPLTSSLPPELQKVDRVRLQFGTGELSKPVLLKKPQAFNPNPPANGSLQGSGGSAANNSFRSPTIADTVPALAPNEISRTSFNSTQPTGPIETQNGNRKVVSNSSLQAVKQTSFLTQGNAQLQGNGRTLQNYDNVRLSDRRGASLEPTGTGVNPTNVNGGNINNTNANGNGNGNGTAGNGGFTGNGSFTGNGGAATTGYGPGSIRGNVDNSNNGMSPVAPRNPNAGSGSTWVGQNNGQGQAYQPPNNTVATNPNYSPNSGTGFPNAVNPNFQNPNTNYTPQNPNYIPAVQPPNPYAYPVTAPVAQPAQQNPIVEAMQKKIDEMEKQAEERDRQEKLEKIQEAAKKDKEDADRRIKALEAEKEKSKNEPTDNKVTPVANSGVTPIVGDDDSAKGGGSVAITIFLLFSIGLNVFLVLQYLSVQNQFRDLSNDLRDSFMANSYE